VRGYGGRGLQVLVVDDEEADLLGLVTILEGAGFDVSRAESVQGAIARYTAEPVDVVVTDIVMPDVDGVELIQGLRMWKRDLPIIAVSGKGSAGLAAAKAMGAARILAKPVEPGELIRAVREVMAPKGR